MEKSSPTPIPKSVFWLVLWSLVLQVAMIGVFREYRTRPQEDHFGFGWEMGRVARSIALGQGFSNPYGDNTGPTAWEPPLYPYLMAGVFKLFGIYSYASAWVLLTINSLFAALTTIPIFLIARRTFGDRVAIWSAWGWALNPYIWYWSIHWIWDTTFTPLVLSLIFLVALELQDWRGLQGWVIFACLWGVGALANPSMLAFLPFCGLWIWRQRFKNGLPSLAGIALSSAIFFLVLLPWLVRNYEVFGRFVFLRDDFGLQFRLGNSKGAEGMLMAYLQPNLNKLEFEKFQRMGELAYAARLQTAGFRVGPGKSQTLRGDQPEEIFLLLERRTQAHRQPCSMGLPQLVVSGVVRACNLGRGSSRAAEGARSMAFRGTAPDLPTTYYFVFPHARYRHPIEPELLILAVFLLLQTGKKASRAVADKSV
jgi:4-amino-4-deoxy-L-arabinose transferase-like glycosyltransferase